MKLSGVGGAIGSIDRWLKEKSRAVLTSPLPGLAGEKSCVFASVMPIMSIRWWASVDPSTRRA